MVSIEIDKNCVCVYEEKDKIVKTVIETVSVCLSFDYVVFFILFVCFLVLDFRLNE